MTAYGTSPTKSRRRRTRGQLEDVRAAIERVLSVENPATVRGVFYQMSVIGAVPKTEAGYRTVQRLLVEMRRSGRIPYGWIADNTRWMSKPRTWSDIGEAFDSMHSDYRRAIWEQQDAYVEIWCEKDALSAVLYKVTSKWDVPLMTTRGFASVTFLHEAAEDIAEQSKPAYLYYFGDHDPSGVVIDKKVEQTIREMAPDAEIHFERVAVLPWQIEEWSLPTRPTKRSDSRCRDFDGESVEVDAISPSRLREICEGVIVQHIDQAMLRRTRLTEAAERDFTASYAAQVRSLLAGSGGSSDPR